MIEKDSGLSYDAKNVRIENGILHFKDIESVKEFYNIAELEGFMKFNSDFLKTFHQKGFRPYLKTPDFFENNYTSFAESSFRNEGGGEGGQNELDTIDLEDDRLIADYAFASLLNEDKEIIVNDSLYKYTFDGLFFGELSDSSTIRLESTINKSNNHNPSIGGHTQILSNGSVFWFIPNDHPPVFEICPLPCPPPTIVNPPPPIDCSDNNGYPEALPACSDNGSGISQIFGVNISCRAYWSSTRRIKNKAWAQNYYLFSSVGKKVKTQRLKNFIGITYWTKSGAEVNWLYQGHQIGEMVFSLPEPPSDIYNFQFDHQIRFDGITYDFNTGNIVPSSEITTRDLFDNFPLDPEHSVIEIYLPDPLIEILGSSYEITGSDINSLVKSLAEDAYDFLENLIQEDVDSESVAIIGTDLENQEIIFTYIEYGNKNHNENRIRHSYHFSTAVVGIRTNISGGGGASPIYSTPNYPERLNFLVYGYGIHGCNDFKGHRIHLKQGQ